MAHFKKNSDVTYFETGSESKFDEKESSRPHQIIFCRNCKDLIHLSQFKLHSDSETLEPEKATLQAFRNTDFLHTGCYLCQSKQESSGSK